MVALRIIPQRLEAAQRAVRTCSLERDSGEKCERPRARRNAVREQTDELGERNGMRMLEVIIIIRHAQIFRERATHTCGQQGRVTSGTVPPCLVQEPLPPISIRNVNDSTTGMRLKERGRAELDSHSNSDVE